MRSHHPKLSSPSGEATDPGSGGEEEEAGMSRCGAVGKEKSSAWKGKARIKAFCKARVLEWKSGPDCV